MSIIVIAICVACACGGAVVGYLYGHKVASAAQAELAKVEAEAHKLI